MSPQKYLGLTIKEWLPIIFGIIVLLIVKAGAEIPSL